MQPDPIGYADGLNWCAYTHDDPVNGKDPTGTADSTVAPHDDPQNGVPNGSPDGSSLGDDLEGGFGILGAAVSEVPVTATCFNNPNLYGCSPTQPSYVSGGSGPPATGTAVEATGRRKVGSRKRT